jgi:2-methylisocitrate lyase-like PEP mutase family enzyme
MTNPQQHRDALKGLITLGKTLIVPGAHDPISAKLIEDAGFPAVYVGSYATAATRLGLPDVGLLTMDEMVAHARSIVDSVDIPVLADGESGWFKAANVWRTIRAFESAGVCGIHIEDHEFGKHAPVTPRLASIEQAVQKTRAAVESRTDPKFLIMHAPMPYGSPTTWKKPSDASTPLQMLALTSSCRPEFRPKRWPKSELRSKLW